jgi:hypothetical protein
MAKRTKSMAGGAQTGSLGGVGVGMSLLAVAFAALAFTTYILIRNAEERNGRLALETAAQRSWSSRWRGPPRARSRGTRGHSGVCAATAIAFKAGWTP